MSETFTEATNHGDAALVRLADRVVTIQELRARPARFTSLFVRARGEVGHAVCLCRADQPPRLVIRCRSGRYHLAGQRTPPHTQLPVVPRTFLSVRPQRLHRRDNHDRRQHSDPTEHTPGRTWLIGPVRTTNRALRIGTSTSRRAMGLLALLHYLWEQAQLNMWQPGPRRRTWHTCRSRLAVQITGHHVNRLELRDTLWIVPPFRPDTVQRINIAWEQFLARLNRAGRSRRRGLVLGEIRTTAATQYGVRVHLAHQRAPLFATQELMRRAERSYPTGFSAEASESSRRQVVLCLVELSARGWPLLIDLAAMLTTGTYLPADSGHEVEMADALVEARRTFLKPLRYDRSDAVFPDFVLLDSDPHTYVEVWGVQGREDYENRKQAKQAHYRKSGRPLLEWNVRDPLPDVTL